MEDVEPMHKPYDLLKEITDGFSDERILRKGTFGVVYKGDNNDGHEIAVKLLNPIQVVNDETFHRQCKTLGKLKHQNIVQLVGFCNETEQLLVEQNGKQFCAFKMNRALCFEYMQNETLQKYISVDSLKFGWHEHYNIIKGICEGLKYLQTVLESPIYHLHLKPDNILLDKTMVPKIADFGFPMLLGEESIRFAGPSVYMPPEYMKLEEISKKFDIFSLGVIILNILTGLTGCSIIDQMEPLEVIERVYNKWKERLQALPSYSLLEADCQQVKRCVEMAVKCLQQDRHKRPSIEEILQELNETETIAFVIQSMHIGKMDHCTGRRGNLDNGEPMNMPYELLNRITDGFSSDRILGNGTFGVVYKGIDKAGTEIAVKILKSLQGVEDVEFDREFTNLSKLRHQNIVQFLGFCNETEEVPTEHEGKQIVALKMHRALCFDYMHNGSLQRHIFDVNQGLCWQERYNIIKGICEGLKYLHMGLESPIHHLDLKPDNILLDKNMVPKIADFGLSRLIGEENTRKTINTVGTWGYCPPEFIKYQIISRKFDIFSLGVIILKIICGKTGYSLVCDMKPAKFIKHIHNNWRERLRATLGSTQEIDCQQVKKCLEVALKCVEEDKERRPSINYIVDELAETEKCKNDRVPLANEFDDKQSILHKSNVLARRYRGINQAEMTRRGDKSSLLSTLPKNLPAEFLKEITDGFSPERKLSQGPFGTVYKGFLQDGEPVAVKRLAHNSPVAHEMQFQNEVSNLMAIEHENIVKLVGYCHEAQKKLVQHNGRYIIVDVVESLLCFEYASMGSLANYIFDESSKSDWASRFKIIEGICLGIHFLHKELDEPIIHMDLQPDNILLDDNMVPKISEFGLSRLFGEVQTRINTRNVVGFKGYMAPEYLYRGEISPQSDIYSLGVLIIEITTGEKNISSNTDMSSRDFIDKLHQTWTGWHIEEKYSSLEAKSLQQIKTCIKIGLKCVDVDKRKRPTIVEILDMIYMASKIHFVSTELLGVYPGKLHLPFEANTLTSCSLQLTNTTDDRIAVRLLTKHAKKYMAKMPVCCVVPPKSIYTLIVTSSGQNRQSLPSSDEFLTLESSICGERDIGLVNGNEECAAMEFRKFFKEAKETAADMVHELKLDVVSDPLEETTSGQPQQSEIVIISDRKFLHVLSVDVHPTEPWIMTTNNAGEVVIWDYKAQAIVHSFDFTRKPGPVYSAKFIEREQWLVAGDGFGTIYVYNYDTEEDVRSIDAHDGDIMSLAVHPTDPLVLSSSNDHLIKLWDWKKDWECTRTFEGHMDRVTHVNFNPMDANSFLTACLDYTIKIWNVSSSESTITLSDHPDDLLCVHSYTSDMRQYLIAGSDGTAQIWDMETGRCVQTLKGHVSRISCVQRHPDVPVVITGSHDGTLRLWNSTTYRLENIVGINLGAVYALGYIKDLRRIIVGCHQGIAIMEIELT